MTADTKLFVLRALRRMDGTPFPEESLIQSVQVAFPHPVPSMDEVRTLLSDMEADGWISAHTDSLTGKRQWVLTSKGTARAVQLR
jgi:hypothetical protein